MSNIDTAQQANPLRTTWFAHIAAWKQSGRTQRAFCHEHNLSYTTFGYWHKQYLGKKRPSQKSTTRKTASDLVSCKNPAVGFVAIEVASSPLSFAAEGVKVQLGRLVLTLPLTMPMADMAWLLRELGGCHAN